MNGTSLVIGTASGQRVTVTTSASAVVSVAGALLSEVTDGAPVIVRRSQSAVTTSSTTSVPASASRVAMAPKGTVA